MPVRSASANWTGSLQQGSGTMRLGSGAYEGQYSFSSRFESGTGTNPEELIGAAEAGCFSMALSADLGRAGYEPRSVATTAEVHLNKTDSGFEIPRIDLRTEADVPGISQEELEKVAQGTKQTCPVSKLLSSAEINLEIKLVG